MFESSYLEISKTALKNNLKYLRGRIGKDVVFSSVIKGNAYGHGIEHFLPIAEQCGVNHFSVFSAHEALRASRCKSKGSDIMIMGVIENDELEWAIRHNVSFFVFEMDRLKATVKTARKLKKKARIHLHLETGFHRMGFESEQLQEVANYVKKNQKYLEYEGISTHYAGAEGVENYLRVKTQIERYNERVNWFENEGISPKYRHTACSAAVLNYPETIMDMVRVGIAQYGFWPNQETFMKNMKNELIESVQNKTQFDDPLKRILSWKSKVMNVKEVDAGEFVGYGTSYLTTRKEKLAAVPIGYAHGFSRSLSNIGKVLIRGKRARVVGFVNMNAIMIDVTDIPHARKGDEVVLIGNQKKDSISVASFSELSNHLNYELLTRLPSNIPRIVVE